MICIARIKVLSDDRPRRVDAIGHGALECACARARSIERGDATLRVAHEAVIHAARVSEPASDVQVPKRFPENWSLGLPKDDVPEEPVAFKNL